MGKDLLAANLVMQRCQWWVGQNDRADSENDRPSSKYLRLLIFHMPLHAPRPLGNDSSAGSRGRLCSVPPLLNTCLSVWAHIFKSCSPPNLAALAPAPTPVFDHNSLIMTVINLLDDPEGSPRLGLSVTWLLT